MRNDVRRIAWMRSIVSDERRHVRRCCRSLKERGGKVFERVLQLLEVEKSLQEGELRRVDEDRRGNAGLAETGEDGWLRAEGISKSRRRRQGCPSASLRIAVVLKLRVVAEGVEGCWHDEGKYERC